MIHGAPVGQPVSNTATVTAVMKIEDENDQLTEIKFTRNAVNYYFYAVMANEPTIHNYWKELGETALFFHGD